MCDNLADYLTADDASSLRQVLTDETAIASVNLHSLAYQAISIGSYQCLDAIVNHDTCESSSIDHHMIDLLLVDAYTPFTTEGSHLPLLHHAIRLGDLHACKLLLENGFHPLVCSGACQTSMQDKSVGLDAIREDCEDAVHYALHYACASNRRNTIAVLLQTTFCESVTFVC
ncbi:protein kinase, partial [Clonorchis sinensis]